MGNKSDNKFKKAAFPSSDIAEFFRGMPFAIDFRVKPNWQVNASQL